jgi:hypothetical protein
MSKKRDGYGWVSMAVLLELFDVERQTFHENIRPKIAPENIRNEGQRGMLFYARGVLDDFVSYKLGQVVNVDEEDAMMEGNSPAQERWRAAKAGMAEIQLAEMLKQVARVDLLKESFAPAIAAMRECGERLIREFGNIAGDVFNTAIDRFEKVLIEQAKRVNGDGDAQSGGADNPGALDGKRHENATDSIKDRVRGGGNNPPDRAPRKPAVQHKAPPRRKAATKRTR